MKIVFFGCDDFAEICLKRLIDDGHAVAALVTRPDRPKGRGLHVIHSPTKALALKRYMEVFQPDDLKDEAVISRLKNYDADVFVVVAYGKLLPETVLGVPKYFCINVHPSLLPKYRGAAPVNWAIINGETETGVTLIKMNAAMDGGDILLQEKHPLPEDMNAAILRGELALKGAEMLSGLLTDIPDGKYKLRKQDSARSTRAPKMHKDLGHICWSDPAKKIHDLVRGTQPWPGSYTMLRGQLLKILETGAEGQMSEARGQKMAEGAVVAVDKQGFFVQAGDRAVLVRRVHPAGGKAMDARSFLSGHKLAVGDRLD